MSDSSDDDGFWERAVRTLREGDPPTAEVFVRSLAPPIGGHQTQETLVDRLHDLEREDRLATVDVTVWGDGVCPDGCCAETTAGREILDRAMELERWATDADAEVELPFEEVHVSSTVTDETFRKIVLPQVTLGVYADEGLALVLPARIDGEQFCVDDFLTAVAETKRTEPDIEPSV